MRRLPDEGYLSTHRYLSAEPTPHPAECVVGVGVALSHKGRGRSNERRQERVERKAKNADQVRRADGAEKSRPEIRLHRSRGDALRLRHRHGRRPDGRKRARVRQRSRRHAAPAESGADFCVGRGVGRGSRRDESQPRHGGGRRARHHLPQAAGNRRPHHRRFQRARRLRQGQGQGRGDPPPDGAQGREGREARNIGRLSLRARRRRLWRAVRGPARTA